MRSAFVIGVMAAVLLAGMLAFGFSSVVVPTSQDRDMTLTVQQYAFSPSRFVARAGDRITLRLRTLDVTHGFALEGTTLDAKVVPGKETIVTFPADRAGKLRYRCSAICGPLHPFMMGEIVVQPNYGFWAATGLALLVGLASVGAVAFRAADAPGNPQRIPAGTPTARASQRLSAALRGLDLLRLRPLRWLLTRRPFQFALIVPNLLAFTLIILTGLMGTSTGARNFATIFVWVVWWGLLVLFLIPLGARAWCAMCPIPAAGEWLARGGFVGRGNRVLTLGWQWPKRWQNLWPAFVGLTLLVLFGLMITTRPLVTALMLLGLMAVAVITHFLFERRVFCRSLCPVGGLIGVYAMAAPLELRRRDHDICRRCKSKACYRGSLDDDLTGGYPCPTFQFPGGGLERNTYCLLCTECLKACPYDNLALCVRPFGADLLIHKGRRADEAWIALLLLGTGLAHTAIKLGPWGWLKEWANLSSLGGFACTPSSSSAVCWDCCRAFSCWWPGCRVWRRERGRLPSSASSWTMPTP